MKRLFARSGGRRGEREGEREGGLVSWLGGPTEAEARRTYDWGSSARADERVRTSSSIWTAEADMFELGKSRGGCGGSGRSSRSEGQWVGDRVKG